MNPMPADPVTSPSKVPRRVMCRFYNSCLDSAIGLGWSGFSCEFCQEFQFEHDSDPDWWAEQAEKSRALLMDSSLFPRWLLSRFKREYHKDFS